jgi:hypothetical protein
MVSAGNERPESTRLQQTARFLNLHPAIARDDHLEVNLKTFKRTGQVTEGERESEQRLVRSIRGTKQKSQQHKNGI